MMTAPDPDTFPKGGPDEARAIDEDTASPLKDNNHPPAKSSPFLFAFWLAMISVLMAGLYMGGMAGRLGAYAAKPVDLYLRRSGLVLKKIVIRGQERLNDELVVKALEIRTGHSLLGFDALKAQDRLAKLGGVRKARVMRLLPSTLLVEITERRPFARWLRGDRLFLIDRDGVVLRALLPDEASRYPLVSGEGANLRAASLMRLLSVHPHLAAKIRAAEHVAGRYWNLHTQKGTIIKLPANNLSLSLARFVALANAPTYLAQPGWRVDLRLGDKIFVRWISQIPAAMLDQGRGGRS